MSWMRPFSDEGLVLETHPFRDRDLVVALAALGGAFLWQIGPEVNLWTAFGFGLAGTVGFALFGRDLAAERQEG